MRPRYRHGTATARIVRLAFRGPVHGGRGSHSRRSGSGRDGRSGVLRRGTQAGEHRVVAQAGGAVVRPQQRQQGGDGGAARFLDFLGGHEEPRGQA